MSTGFESKRLSLLIDLEKQFPLWRINTDSTSTAAVLPSGLYAFTADTGDQPPCTLMTTPLPHPAATKAAASLPPGDMLLKPGSSLSLQVNLSGIPDAARDEIVKHITQQLQENKIAIEENQPIQLILSIERGKTQPRQYRTRTGPFAEPGPTQTVNITQKVCRMKIVAAGSTAWEVGDTFGNPGDFLEVRPGQTAQQVADAQSQVDPRFFMSVKLPAYLVKQRKPPYLGTSEPTPQGLRDK